MTYAPLRLLLSKKLCNSKPLIMLKICVYMQLWWLNITHPNKSDASQICLGACLIQKHESTWRPVFSASKGLTATEKRCYSAIEKEALAVCWSCEKFNNHLIGISFTIETDHSPLIQSFTSKQIHELSPRNASGSD